MKERPNDQERVDRLCREYEVHGELPTVILQAIRETRDECADLLVERVITVGRRRPLLALKTAEADIRKLGGKS